MPFIIGIIMAACAAGALYVLVRGRQAVDEDGFDEWLASRRSITEKAEERAYGRKGARP